MYVRASLAGALGILLTSAALAQPVQGPLFVPHLPDADPPAGVPSGQVQFKLSEAHEPRIVDGRIVGVGLVELERLRSTYGILFERLIRVDDGRLAELRERAARRSGRVQPDLRTLFAVSTPLDEAELLSVAQGLERLDAVDWVQIEALGAPPPVDLAPPTPDFTSNQLYVDTAAGLDISAARSRGLTGTGIRVSDCEYGWINDHEDLDTVFEEPNQTPNDGVAERGWDNHGAAVVGIWATMSNGYGMSGTAFDAEFWTYPEWTNEDGLRRASAIASAIADSDVGDVVVLEMQTIGRSGGNYVPAELNSSVWTVVKQGTDAGVVVVAAAGNGDENLDDPAYQYYRDRGDSGAIIVGAGSNNTTHSKLGFSTHGTRVDVQGWGTGVATIGYGNLARVGDDKRQTYTASFNGTSSATPIVTSAIVLIQERAASILGRTLSSQEMRQVLINTGVPQGGNTSERIGPFPDLEGAFQWVENRQVALEPLMLGEVPEGTRVQLSAVASTAVGTLDYSWLIDGQAAAGPTVEFDAVDDASVPVEVEVTSDFGVSARSGGLLTVVNVPPTLTSTVAPAAVTEGDRVRQPFVVVDPGTDTVTLEIVEGQVDGTDARIEGTSLVFTPRYEDAQAGRLSFGVRATDDDGGIAEAGVEYEVRYLDADADGVPDTWERENGFDPTDPSDAASDSDGDGRSLRDEFEEGSDPNRDDRPSAPELVAPASGAVTSTRTLVARATDVAAPHRFRLWSESGEVLRESEPVSVDGDQIRWRIDPAPAENEIVRWDAVAFDAYADSQAPQARSFLYSTINDAPEPPRVVDLGVQVSLTRAAVRIEVEPGADPEGDSVHVEARLELGGEIVAQAEGRESSADAGSVELGLEGPRLEGLTWSVRSVDADGAASDWSAPVRIEGLAPNPPLEAAGGCTCAASSSPAPAIWVLLLGAAWLWWSQSRPTRIRVRSRARRPSDA